MMVGDQFVNDDYVCRTSSAQEYRAGLIRATVQMPLLHYFSIFPRSLSIRSLQSGWGAYARRSRLPRDIKNSNVSANFFGKPVP